MSDPKVALVTTTINVPEVLRLYHALEGNVAFFVAGDLKTPPACEELCRSLGENFYGENGENVHYLSPDFQKSLGYKCSDLLPWNSISRRNIATLEALKWGADIIVMIDDDNIPLDTAYFDHHVSALSYPHFGVRARGLSGWFDVGQLLDPTAPHRGFPHDQPTLWVASPSVGAKVGINAGICLGNPDIGAVTRIATKPEVHRVSELLQRGLVIDPHTWTVTNSQNTAIIRELAPSMFMFPGFQRYDDIYASLICQRVMRERDLHVRFGAPYVFQERNQHDLIKDLRAEIDGMENVVRFSEQLSRATLHGQDIVSDVRTIVGAMDYWLTRQAVEAYRAWCDDVEKVM